MTRAEGIPEMRQGAAPGFPPGQEGPALVVAEVTLLPDGSVAEASIRSGESPWAEGLLLAIRTWRFAAAPDGAEIVFTVEANFVSPGRPGQPPRVELKLVGPQRREVATTPPLGAPTPDAAPGVAPSPAAEATQPAAVAVASPAPAPAAMPSPEPVMPSPVAQAPPAVSPAGPAAGPAAPPVEVITGPAEAPSRPCATSRSRRACRTS
jgi:hypothetical protein